MVPVVSRIFLLALVVSLGEGADASILGRECKALKMIRPLRPKLRSSAFTCSRLNSAKFLDNISCLRAGSSDLNSTSTPTTTAATTTTTTTPTRVLRPLHPLTKFDIPQYPPNRGTLVRKSHWNARMDHLRASIWETQKSLGKTLYHLRKRSLEHQESQTDSDIALYDLESDDEDEDSEFGRSVRPKQKQLGSMTSLGPSISPGPAQDFLDDVLAYSHTLPLEEWGFGAISSFLSLVTCIYCYGMVSRNLHWDWSIYDFDTFDTLYGTLEWVWNVAPDMLCLIAGASGMLSGLYATCVYSLLSFHGRQLTMQHQLNNPLYHYRTQALVENFLKSTSSVRDNGFRSFRMSLSSLGIQIPLLLAFRLPSWFEVRIPVTLMLALAVRKILKDAQSILVRPSGLSESSSTLPVNSTLVEPQ